MTTLLKDSPLVAKLLEKGKKEGYVTQEEVLEYFAPAEEVERELEVQAAHDVTVTSDPVRMYLREIGRTPLLTKADEVTLAQQIEKGTAAVLRLKKAPPRMGRVTRGKLKEKARVGDVARDKLTKANLRLVGSIAQKYLGRG